tara:strand:+ start:68 stop:238 length:171 start_codon:yes stop_codon:yes gene_type:complete
MLSRVFLIKRGKCCGHKCYMCPFEDKHSGSSNVVRVDILNNLNELEIKELNNLTIK